MKNNKQNLIDDLVSFFSVEDKETLLDRIECILTTLSEEEVRSIYCEFSDMYPEMFPQLGYNESENTNDFYENGDPDDCDPAGGYGIKSHI